MPKIQNITLILSIIFYGTGVQAHPELPKDVKTSDNNQTTMHPAIQTITTEAQKTLGVISPLPVEYMDPKDPITQFLGAATTQNCIYVNPSILEHPYGYVRASLYHEAVHAKYEDPKNLPNFLIPSTLLGGVAGYTACRKLSKTKRFAAVIFGLEVANRLTRFLALEFVEKRADREGFRATQCGACVGEVTASREAYTSQKKSNPFNFTGYISAEEAYSIAKELEGKTCTYHITPEKQAEAQYNITILQKQTQQWEQHHAHFAELQEAEHAATDKEEQYMKRFQ